MGGTYQNGAHDLFVSWSSNESRWCKFVHFDKKICKGKQTCIKTLNRFNIHSKTAGFNTTQHWVKYGQTQRLGWFWHRRLVKHLTQLLVEKSPITGFVHILPSIFLSVVNNIGCPLFTRPGWNGYLMRNKKIRQDWIVSIGNWLDCKRGRLFSLNERALMNRAQ